jgi:hypothetical protein
MTRPELRQGPYDARFVGGPLDGQTLKVPSMLPDRFVWEGGKVAIGTKPPVVPFDRYRAVQYDPELVYEWKGRQE